MTDPYPVAYLNRPGRPHSTPSPDLNPPGHQVSKPTQKKAGASAGTGKGKGSVRAKSGCYTCRIRRKKCDEIRDKNDNCQTCVRLRLECLGFGQKRPDWMRENNSVPDLREKIKQFLASQGMIKGHSGSGSRNVDSNQAGPILKLSEIGQNKQHTLSASGVPQAANTSSGPRSAGSSVASSPQSPRSPPIPPNTLYHPPPPQSHYSPSHAHPQHSDAPRYPHVNTSYARDPPRSGEMIYSPVSPDLPTPATATSTGPVGHPHSGHGHGHSHGDPYNSPVTSVHRPSLSSQGSHLLRNDGHHLDTGSVRFPPTYTETRYGPDTSLDTVSSRSPGPDASRYNNNYYSPASHSYSQRSPVLHSPTLPSQPSSSYNSTQSHYPGSSMHTSYSTQVPPPQSQPPRHSSHYTSGNHYYPEPPITRPIRQSQMPTTQNSTPKVRNLSTLSSRFNPSHTRTADTQAVYSPVTSTSPSHLHPPIKGSREGQYYPQRSDSQYTDFSGTGSDSAVKHEPQEPTVKYESEDTKISMRPNNYSRSQASQSSHASDYSSAQQSSPVNVISPVHQEMTYPTDGAYYPQAVDAKPTVSFHQEQEQDTSQYQLGYNPPIQGITLMQAIQDARRPLRSGLSEVYTRAIDISDADKDEVMDLTPQETGGALSSVGRISSQNAIEIQYIGYYLTDVLSRQYVFADRVVAQRFLSILSQTSNSTKDAMCLLASLHMQAMWEVDKTKSQQPGNQVATRPTLDHFDWASVNNHFYKCVAEALGVSANNERRKIEYTEGDAMAGLHLVSSFLFSGGRGPWPVFLNVAMDWVESRRTVVRNSAELLENVSESEQFITRTTFWFDVWGSITQRRQPRFMSVYRDLFGVTRDAFIGDRLPQHWGPISMVNIIGCSNDSFRAMAEIATLAAWKDENSQVGQLSSVKLVQRGYEIEKKWLERKDEIMTPLGDKETEIDFQRRIASEVFRSSARVYLHMVLSSASPRISEIKEGVVETINLLQRIPHEDVVSTAAIVRSVISAICICGCLTEDHKQVEFFMRRLDSLGEEADLFGNIRTVKVLIKRVWNLRLELERATPVDWREVLLEEDKDVVLLV